jgi:exopolyphosphatase/guanosine-5'-triphosphate,3'-diphosphate pyrophosphatase
MLSIVSRYAAFDIGSNSIRMLAAEVDLHKPMKVLAEDRQVVRLGTSVFREGRLTEASMELSLQVLQRMSAEYRKHDVLAVRAVGTAALRDASNQAEFLERAATIVGAPIEVISGLEEARLVQLGVQSRWPHPDKRLLIVDIGGGSAELILSENGRFVEAFSKPLGAVRLTEMFLKSDPADPREIARMQRYIQERIAGPIARLSRTKIDRMIATSSTAAATVCAVSQLKRARRAEADRKGAGARQVRDLFLDVAGRNLSKRAQVTGIGPRRAEIIVAGVAVLNEIIHGMKLPRMYFSAAGVRDGVIADLARRKVGLEKTRMDPDQLRVVRALTRQYGINTQHVKKVGDLASMLFEDLRTLHRLPPHVGRILDASAFLYNIGHFVNEAKHHRHSFYLVANSDLPGFDDREHMMIANLCRYHRKSMPQDGHESFQALPPEDRRTVQLLTPLLRAAVALDQSQEQRVERVEAVVQDASVELRLYSKHDVDIEQWQASQVSPDFAQIYGLPLGVRIKR